MCNWISIGYRAADSSLVVEQQEPPLDIDLNWKGT